jgi:hypothetical protein
MCKSFISWKLFPFYTTIKEWGKEKLQYGKEYLARNMALVLVYYYVLLLGQNKIQYIEKVNIYTLTLCYAYNYHKIASN